MSYVVYVISDSRIATETSFGNGYYGTERAAKAARTRMINKGLYKPNTLAISNNETYHNSIEKMVERVNLISGQTFMESVNTPSYCSPASESYWSM